MTVFVYQIKPKLMIIHKGASCDAVSIQVISNVLKGRIIEQNPILCTSKVHKIWKDCLLQ